MKAEDRFMLFEVKLIEMGSSGMGIRVWRDGNCLDEVGPPCVGTLSQAWGGPASPPKTWNMGLGENLGGKR